MQAIRCVRNARPDEKNLVRIQRKQVIGYLLLFLESLRGLYEKFDIQTEKILALGFNGLIDVLQDGVAKVPVGQEDALEDEEAEDEPPVVEPIPEDVQHLFG